MGIPFYSDPAILWIYKSVVITRQIDDGSPLLGTVYVGDGVETTLSVGAEGQEPLTYLWQYQDSDDPVEYLVHVCGHELESGATCGYTYDDTYETVKWSDLPDDWTCPSCGAPKSEFSEETRTSVLWIDIPNSNSPQYTFVPKKAMNTYSYRVIVSNPGGSAISNPVT